MSPKYNTNPDGDNSSPRPLLSVLTSFECHFANEAKIIKGGKDLLNALAQQVHQQAQVILSGVTAVSKTTQQTKSDHLQLTALETGKFSLSIPEALLQSFASDAKDEKEKDEAKTDSKVNQNTSSALDIQLSTVQLFDLVEALDQLMDDSQTLPDLSLALKPLSRRQVKSQDTGQKTVPFVLGAASLAIAAAIAYIIPVPEITKPTPPETESVTDSEPAGINTPEGGAPPDTTPNTSSEPEASLEVGVPEVSESPAESEASEAEVTPETQP